MENSKVLPMSGRGVTRPMAEKEVRESESDSPEDNRLDQLHSHHRQTLWVYWSLIVFGLWMLAAPFTLGYLNEALWRNPSGGRGVWFSELPHTALRAYLMTGSDLLSGLFLLVFGWRSLTPNRPKSLWACCFVGIWLTFAPILFWAPTLGAYLNNTLTGALLIALTILVPGMPNMIRYMKMGPPTPPGWSYNPSSWAQRWILIATGLFGWLVSRYLAVFQLGYTTSVWDPVFGFAQGTREVLNSSLSHAWPISDAGLGSLSYTFEFLMGFMGSPSRWRTMPWMVAFFGILVIPLGLTHIFLVISQPVLVHHWCLFCLLAALIMLPMIPLEVDEVIAMGQHLVQAKRRGDRGGSLWKIFWKGGSAEGCTKDERSPALIEMPQQLSHTLKASVWGMSCPPTLVIATCLGLLLMLLPGWLGIPITAFSADVGHLGGALVITVSVVCMGEVLRRGRLLNLPLGLAIAVLPWFSSHSQIVYNVVCVVAGVLIMGLSLPRGVIRESYGSWDRFVH